MHTLTAETPFSIGGIGGEDIGALGNEIFLAGTDVLFSSESLQSSQDPLSTIVDAAFGSSSKPNTLLRMLPRIFEVYLQEIRKHRSALFSSGSSSTQQQQAVQVKLRAAGISALSACYTAIRKWGDELEVWQCALSLLRVAEEAKMLGFGSREERDVLGDVGNWATSALAQWRSCKALHSI